jgi:outer membrane protein OmpA-like peptidoglycan-associated protein
MDVNTRKAGGPAASRRWRRMMLTAGLVLGGLLGGCSSNLQERVALLDEENGRLRASLDEKNGALDSMQRDLEDCRGEQIALLSRNAELEAMGAPTSGDGNAFGQIPGVESSASGGVITARMEGDVLFSSGQTQLRDAAKRSLDEVARVIRSQFPGTSIRVSGHTDSDPIVKTKDRFPTNYHLGFERAFAVREYLIGRGIPATSISVESFGPARPAGSKQRSRRVEISVLAG